VDDELNLSHSFTNSLEHLPAIQACKELSLKAIYSRSRGSAEKLAERSGSGVDVYYDNPKNPEDSIDALLGRQDIKAVVIAVTISFAPVLIRKALDAGKHVLSEKPIAPSVAEARALLGYYRKATSAHPGVIWAVAENFRFWPTVNRAAELLRQLGGALLSFKVDVYNHVGQDNKFAQTTW
jgi:predicted dehydrogenase